VLTLNADTWHDADLQAFVAGWDGERVRLLVAGEDFGPPARVVASLLPWRDIELLEARPTGLYEVSWRPAQDAKRLDIARYDGVFFDCGTPSGYLDANLSASGGRSVVGPGAQVDGAVEDCVVWPGAHVEPHERLRRAVRAGEHVTVLVRR
jgi:hypothetical protein